MESEADEAVIEAIRRRDAREAGRITDEKKQWRNRWIRKGLVPAAVLFPVWVVPYIGGLIALSIAMPWIIYCTVKIVPCLTWANTCWKRIAAGFPIFLLLLVLNVLIPPVLIYVLLTLIWLVQLPWSPS